MKILFASQSFYPHIGGVSTYLLNLAKELKSRGHIIEEVHLRPSGEDSRDEIKGIIIFRVPREPLNRKMLGGYSKFKEAIYKECHNYPGIFKKIPIEMEGYDDYLKINEEFGEQLRLMLNGTPVDIVHVHDFQLLYLYKYVPRGTPLILTWHIPFLKTMSKTLKKFLIKHMIQYDRVVFSSQGYIDAAVSAGMPFEKCVLVHPICNTVLFQFKKIKKTKIFRKYKIPIYSKIILCVQRIDPKSGHEQLIKSMPEILRKVPKARLVFVGTESLSNKISRDRQVYQDRVFSLIKSLKLKNNVMFLGNVDYLDLPDVYNSADLVALCSKMEGFGLSVTEGMACGKPIVGTNVGGIPLQVKNNQNGLLVQPGDIKETAQAIIRILKNKHLSSQFGRKSLRFIKESFSMQIGIDKHIHLYNSLMREKNESRRLEKMDINNVNALIIDYDRTLTDIPGKLNKKVIDQLKRLDTTHILATGRKFDYIKTLSDKFKLWDCIVCENGAVIYFPNSRKTIIINSEYINKARLLLKKTKIPAQYGQVVISVNIKYLPTIKKILKEIINELNLVNNVNEVMILPKYVDKGKGLRMLLDLIDIEPEKTIIVGDAENDVDLFNVAGYKVAVANAHPKLKLIADQITENPSSKGVIEIVNKLLSK